MVPDGTHEMDLSALLIRTTGVRIPLGALFPQVSRHMRLCPMAYRTPGHSFGSKWDNFVTVEAAGRMDAGHDVGAQALGWAPCSVPDGSEERAPVWGPLAVLADEGFSPRCW
jgi:hypothetical protein